MPLLISAKALTIASSKLRIPTTPSARSLWVARALLVLNSAREVAYSPAAAASISPLLGRVEAFPHASVDAERQGRARLVPARVVVIVRSPVQPHGRVEPRPDPFAGVDRTGLQRLHDVRAGHEHNGGAETAVDPGTRARHPVTQPTERLDRGDLIDEPAAHLRAGAGAEERLDTELGAERIPKLLAYAEPDPSKELVGRKAERNARVEMKGRRFLLEVADMRMEHVDDAGLDGVEGLGKRLPAVDLPHPDLARRE